MMCSSVGQDNALTMNPSSENELQGSNSRTDTGQQRCTLSVELSLEPKEKMLTAATVCFVTSIMLSLLVACNLVIIKDVRPITSATVYAGLGVIDTPLAVSAFFFLKYLYLAAAQELRSRNIRELKDLPKIWSSRARTS